MLQCGNASAGAPAHCYHLVPGIDLDQAWQPAIIPGAGISPVLRRVHITALDWGYSERRAFRLYVPTLERGSDPGPVLHRSHAPAWERCPMTLPRPGISSPGAACYAMTQERQTLRSHAGAWERSGDRCYPMVLPFPLLPSPFPLNDFQLRPQSPGRFHGLQD